MMRRLVAILGVVFIFAVPVAAEDGYASPRAWRSVAFTEQVTQTPGPFVLGSGAFTPAIFGPSATGCTAGLIPYSFTGDTNTGVSTSAADTLVFCAGGVAAATVDAAGTFTATTAQLASTGSLGFASRGFLSAGGANGLFLLRNVTITTGVGLDVAIDDEIRITNRAATINAGLSVRYIVEANTGTKSASELESRELYTNTGDADGSIINLPNDPAAGLQFAVAVVAAQTITINTGAGETIWLAGTSCGTDITGSDTGASLLIFAVTGGSGAVWHAIGSGTWTC